MATTQCFHPNHRFVLGINPDTGKTIGKVTSYHVKALIEFDDGTFDYVYDDDSRDPIRFIVYDFVKKVHKDPQVVPCGQCIGCRLKQSLNWATRCMLEARDHDESWFITLTFDDQHLVSELDSVPITYDVETGEVLLEQFNLSRSVLQKFIKRLRKNSGQDIRYYCCGEYGTKTSRPHYHLIVFGLHLDDLKIYKRNFNGNYLYNSALIDKCWKFGHAVIAEVNFDTCAYVARYCTKKLTGKSAVAVYDKYGITPPFTGMSLKPGIARNYYEQYKEDIYKYDKIIMSTTNGGKIVKPPSYFDRLYDIDYPSDAERIKANRKAVAEMQHKNLIKATDMDYSEYLKLQEDNLINKLGKINERNGMI